MLAAAFVSSIRTDRKWFGMLKWKWNYLFVTHIFLFNLLGERSVVGRQKGGWRSFDMRDLLVALKIACNLLRHRQPCSVSCSILSSMTTHRFMLINYRLNGDYDSASLNLNTMSIGHSTHALAHFSGVLRSFKWRGKLKEILNSTRNSV